MVQTYRFNWFVYGVAEKFYSYFYALFLNNLLLPKFDDKTLTNTLMSELANEILVHLSGCKHLELEPKDCSLPEKELKTLQYLAGFSIHKLYTKFRFSRNSARAFHNQYCLILHACKVENDDTQALVNVCDRRWLWKVCKKMQDILMECEILFRTKTSTFTSSLVCKDLVTQSLKDITINSNSMILYYLLIFIWKRISNKFIGAYHDFIFPCSSNLICQRCQRKA